MGVSQAQGGVESERAPLLNIRPLRQGEMTSDQARLVNPESAEENSGDGGVDDTCESCRLHSISGSNTPHRFAETRIGRHRRELRI
jgi:hypothetical protein